MADLATALARGRVPLGFISAVAVVALARPTPRMLMVGGAIAAAGEALRVWAAGHLEKGVEVTSSGPYRFTRHPLYVGSALIGAGVALMSNRWSASVIVAVYLGATLIAAIRHEEDGMRARFGHRYDVYARTGGGGQSRAFSFARAIRNKEHHAIAGLLAAAALFAFMAARHL